MEYKYTRWHSGSAHTQWYPGFRGFVLCRFQKFAASRKEKRIHRWTLQRIGVPKLFDKSNRSSSLDLEQGEGGPLPFPKAKKKAKNTAFSWGGGRKLFVDFPFPRWVLEINLREKRRMSVVERYALIQCWPTSTPKESHKIPQGLVWRPHMYRHILTAGVRN
jgi:hypothetical protein